MSARTTLLALSSLAGLTLVGCSWIYPTEPLRAVPAETTPARFEAVPVEFSHVWRRGAGHHLTGAAVIDVDADGRFELFVGGGAGQADALLAYRDGRLVDRISGTGLSSDATTYGSTSIDIDDDGDVDLLVAREDGVTLYLNQGGRFEARPLALPLPPNSVPLSVAVSDIDSDGDGDLYVSAFVDAAHFVSATFNVPDHAKHNLLLRNDGGLRFTDITTPVTQSLQNTFVSIFVDLDGDRRQDLVVAQNTGEAEILHNLGAGRFERVPFHSGYGFWMGVAAGDIDGDGDQDLFFTNVGDRFPGFLAHGDLHDDQPFAPGWLLLRNDGNLRFADVTHEAGLSALGFAWGATFEDVNLDGRLDLIVAQNYIKWPIHHLFKFPGKVLLAGPGDALDFHPAPVAENAHFSNAPVILDFDGDGHPDLFWLNNDGPSLAYRNATPGHAVVVEMPDDVRALGARVHIEGGPARFTREVHTSDGLGTDQTPVITFGLGSVGRADRVVIEWADGSTSVIDAPASDVPIRIGRKDMGV